jgi:3-oxoacyl-[acyl-carrier-protein] synthase-3
LGLGGFHETADVYALADRAMRKSLERAGVSGPSVDWVIVSAANFQHPYGVQRVGLSRALVANEVDAKGFLAVCGTGCAAMLTAIELARELIGAQRCRTVLVVNIDHVVGDDGRARFIDYALMSDAAASVLLSSVPGLGAAHGLRAMSRFFDASQMRTGLRWNTSDTGKAALEELCCGAGVPLDSVDKVLSLNTFWPVAKARLRALGFAARQQFLGNTSRVGHCLAADPVINLVDSQAQEAGSAPKLRLMLAEADGHAATALLVG